MNKDFTFADAVIFEAKKRVNIYRVLYKGDCIAFFREEDCIKEDISLIDAAEEYINTYGYMAEYRRQWNKGNKVNWSEDLRVVI